MGSGSWTTTSFTSYSSSSKCGATLDSLGRLTGSGVSSNQNIYKQRQIHADLFPKNIVRECRDTDEHPNTIPVILGLDVTGSMGDTAVEVAKSLNLIMTKLYSEIEDVEFCIMGIGDLYCDHAPIQMSQFESDVRIAEQLDKVYFEFGGGGNAYESYTAAWYMGLCHTDLDCWKRGKKGIIITLGDETLNPYLNKDKINNFTGDTCQDDIKTNLLYEEASKKFDIYHINVNHRSYKWLLDDDIPSSFKNVIGESHYYESTLNSLPDVISEIIIKASSNNKATMNIEKQTDGISW